MLAIVDMSTWGSKVHDEARASACNLLMVSTQPQQSMPVQA